MSTITLPVYLTLGKKTIFLSQSWYRNAHYFQQNQAKRDMNEIIKPQLVNLNPISSIYSVTFVYYYKNSASDLPNAGAISSKFFNDVLQSSGIVSNDNVKYLVNENYLVGGEDKLNPRMEIYIKGYKDESEYETFRSNLLGYITNSNV